MKKNDRTMSGALLKGESVAAVRGMKMKKDMVVIALQPMDAEAAHLVLDFLAENIGFVDGGKL